MIKSIYIKNFKSVVDLSLELGTFNVLIGENGCGKSNILEAIAFGAAASADKLDYEFLGSRGIRVTNPDFMFSAFSIDKKRKSIELTFITDKKNYSFELLNDANNAKKWINKNRENALKEYFKALSQKVKAKIAEKNHKVTKVNSDVIDEENSKDSLNDVFDISDNSVEELLFNSDISNYILYSPEQSTLRKFENTNQIYPLGVKGEGLFQYLKELALQKKTNGTLNAIKNNLKFLDWYENFDLAKNLMQNEFALQIKDKYIAQNLKYFDQRSTNEGFLFLLFYSTLFISKSTPTFFAIDNIDVSFNPKLCMQLIKSLSALTKKYKKQVIVTTQNPAILDGLNLKDGNQRLFVVRRNDEGHTKANRIEFKQDRKLKLSEIWTNGFIGGLPENF